MCVRCVGFVVAVVWCVVATVDARAEVRLARIFADHMVLQRDRPVPVWGWTEPGETATVSFAGQTAAVMADGDGAWAVTLAPLTASAVGQTLEVEARGDRLSIRDVLVGDLWHASGQSNMAMSVGEMLDAMPAVEGIITAAELPAVRWCRIDEAESALPRADLRSQAAWQVCSPQAVHGFSAVAFFFADTLHAELGVPVAVIDSSRGGTPIEPFIPREAFVRHPTLERELELADREDLDGIWRLPGGVRARDTVWLPGRLFNSRLAPISRMPVRGCIWYQGESNCGVGEDPRDYGHKMRALVQGWRAMMGRGDLPLFFVQLPGSGAGPGWPYLREQQRLAADMAGVGMVVTVDLEGMGIHPPNKIDVGRRLAGWALAETYGLDMPHLGPMFDQQRIVGGEIVLTFRGAESGLMTAEKDGLAPPRETPGVPPALFEVADSNGVWHPATARIQGTTVVVTSEAVAQPKAARYAYAVTPDGCNLYNGAGLPASPFCSDSSLLTYDPQLPK
jgi:sialate O-acetylesterase